MEHAQAAEDPRSSHGRNKYPWQTEGGKTNGRWDYNRKVRQAPIRSWRWPSRAGAKKNSLSLEVGIVSTNRRNRFKPPPLQTVVKAIEWASLKTSWVSQMAILFHRFQNFKTCCWLKLVHGCSWLMMVTSPHCECLLFFAFASSEVTSMSGLQLKIYQFPWTANPIAAPGPGCHTSLQKPRLLINFTFNGNGSINQNNATVRPGGSSKSAVNTTCGRTGVSPAVAHFTL